MYKLVMIKHQGAHWDESTQTAGTDWHLFMDAAELGVGGSERERETLRERQ